MDLITALAPPALAADTSASITIAAYVLALRIERHTSRIASLAELNAPEMMLDRERELLERATAGELGKVGAPKGESAEELLALDFLDCRWRTGSGGKAYLTFSTAIGSVSYFPAAKFGPFISCAR